MRKIIGYFLVFISPIWILGLIVGIKESWAMGLGIAVISTIVFGSVGLGVRLLEGED